jgi:4-amino-4-deoxy-L-arabinose transferase-like glycosyltransferase
MNLRERWRRKRFVAALLLIALAGLAWRVVYVLLVRHRAVLGDGVHYHTAALYIADGLGFINPIVRGITGASVPDAVHPPAWTLSLAGPSALGMRSWLSHQLIACVVGCGTIVMTGLAGRAAFGKRAGVIAAGLAAFYPFVWLYEREVLSEPLAMFGVATTIWLAYRFRATPTTGLALCLGGSVGLMAMTRSELLSISVLLVAPLILSASRVTWGRRLGWLAMAGAACVALIAPWAIYNETRFERPVPLSNGLGSVMLQGNCAPVYHGARLGFAEFGCLAFVPNLDEEPSVADAQYRDAALDFMRANKERVPVVMAARVGRTFGFYRPFQQMRLESNRSTHIWIIRLAFFAYWILLPLAVAGAVIARRRKIPIWPLLAFPAAVLLSILLTAGDVRYRAPAEIPLVLLAAFALDAAVGTRRRRPTERTPATR